MFEKFRHIPYLLIIFFITFSSFVATSTPTYIFVEGLVGSGKSTLINILQQQMPDVDVMYEPVERWTDVHGTGSLYDLFLKDTRRWALTTEIYVPLARMQSLEFSSGKAGRIYVVDRSIYGDFYVFAKTAYGNGCMTALEWAVYEEWFNWFMMRAPVKPTGFIYLQTTPEVTLARINERGRVEEKDYPLALQKSFHERLEDWFVHKKGITPELAEIPVLIINARQNFRDDLTIQREVVAAITAFIEKVVRIE